MPKKITFNDILQNKIKDFVAPSGGAIHNLLHTTRTLQIGDGRCVVLNKANEWSQPICLR